MEKSKKRTLKKQAKKLARKQLSEKQGKKKTGEKRKEKKHGRKIWFPSSVKKSKEKTCYENTVKKKCIISEKWFEKTVQEKNIIYEKQTALKNNKNVYNKIESKKLSDSTREKAVVSKNGSRKPSNLT